MNKLVIIGNGFDLAHGLKTRVKYLFCKIKSQNKIKTNHAENLSGSTISIDGKEYSRVQMRFVDSLDIDGTKLLLNLEEEVNLLRIEKEMLEDKQRSICQLSTDLQTLNCNLSKDLKMLNTEIAEQKTKIKKLNIKTGILQKMVEEKNEFEKDIFQIQIERKADFDEISRLKSDLESNRKLIQMQRSQLAKLTELGLVLVQNGKKNQLSDGELSLNQTFDLIDIVAQESKKKDKIILKIESELQLLKSLK